MSKQQERILVSIVACLATLALGFGLGRLVDGSTSPSSTPELVFGDPAGARDVTSRRERRPGPARGHLMLAGRCLAWQQDGQVPLPGVTIMAAAAGDPEFTRVVARSVSADDGSFALTGLEPGHYTLLALPRQHPPERIASIQAVDGGDAPPLVLLFGGPRRGAALGGAPAETLEATAPEGASEAVEGSPDTLNSFSTGIPLMEGITHLEGSPVEFITNLSPDGSSSGITVTVGEDGSQMMVKWQSSLSEGEIVEVPAEPEAPVEPSETTAVVRGRVIDTRTGEPLVEASVRLLGRGMDSGSQTDAQGAFTFADVPPGEYAVTLQGLEGASLFRSHAGNQVIEVAAGQSYEVTLSARRVIVVDGVTEGGQASAAGMQAGDEILTYGGELVRTESHLRELRSAVPRNKTSTSSCSVRVRRWCSPSTVVRSAFTLRSPSVWSDRTAPRLDGHPDVSWNPERISQIASQGIPSTYVVFIPSGDPLEVPRSLVLQ